MDSSADCYYIIGVITLSGIYYIIRFYTGNSVSCPTSSIRITRHDIQLHFFQEIRWIIIIFRTSQRLIRTKIPLLQTVQKPTLEDGGTMNAIIPTLTGSICGENQSLALELIG